MYDYFDRLLIIWIKKLEKLNIKKNDFILHIYNENIKKKFIWIIGWRNLILLFMDDDIYLIKVKFARKSNIKVNENSRRFMESSANTLTLSLKCMNQ